MRIITIIIFLFSGFIKSHSSEMPEYSPICESTSPEICTILHKISKLAFYFGVGSALTTSSDLASLGWGFCQLSPQTASTGNELFLFSRLSSSLARHAYSQMLKEFNSSITPFPVSQFSWKLNHKLLSEIPAFSNEDLQLLRFLQERWLAKIAGFSSLAVDWIYPCFDTYLQIHPASNHSYARVLTTRFSKAYSNRMEAWKQTLPHPQHYPLILTRPANIQDYLPPYLEVSDAEQVRSTVQQLMDASTEPMILDLSNLFPKDSLEWSNAWETYRNSFAEACKEYGLNPTRILCIQRIYQKEIGGIRLLPLIGQSTEIFEQQYQFLLDWISCFGLAANRIELDRWPVKADTPLNKEASINKEPPSKKPFLSLLHSLEEEWSKGPTHKTLMLHGTLQVLKGLFSELTEEKWLEIIHCPTRSAIVQFTLPKIMQQLKSLAKKAPKSSFFDLTSMLEEIHANLSSLLEIFAPFPSHQFPSIYRDLLDIPTPLQPLTSCALHSSAMTSLAGVFKAVAKTLGKKPRVLYGENIYFECISAAKKVAHVLAIDDATEEDWKEADLLLVQFNPVLKTEPHSGYRTEKIEELLHQCLTLRNRKPLTVALDCTLDFIHSPRVLHLIHQFQREIEDGILNLIGYRSGNKFDLFGMDNYCGAPFFMIHNQDPKWAFFDSLCKDPVLQTDPLSLNWFCLAYRYASPQLDLYRKQIFENTRALLDRLPARLLNNRTGDYQVLPVDREADAAFIDIKTAGALHVIKACVFVAGTLYTRSMEGGYPIFNRPSLGFYHPNFIMLFGKERSTLRLTLGLDPAQVDLFVKCLETIDALNQ